MAVYTLPGNPELQGMVALIPEIVFSSATGEELALELLKPRWKSGGKGFPLVLFIQGSGWNKPNQYWQLPQFSLLAQRGFVVASITHRSCLTDPAPAFLQDAKAALRFLRAHAEKYDIDRSRAGALGTSSGGNTALLLGLTGNDPAFETDEWAGESTAVQAVAECFGPTDIAKMLRVQPELNERLCALTRNEDPALIRQVSPIEYIRPGLSLPPMLILHGDADQTVLYEDGEAFYQKLTENGYEADLVRVTSAPHEGNFWSMELCEIIFDFFEKALAPKD